MVAEAIEKANLLLAQSAHEKVECQMVKNPNYSERIESSRLKYEAKLLSLNNKLRLSQLESLKAEARYELEIELPTKLEVLRIEEETKVSNRMKEAETRAQVEWIKQIGSAVVEVRTKSRIAEAEGLRLKACALVRLYKAQILDRAASHLLKLITNVFHIDPQLRFKLERPIKIKILLDKQV